MSVAARRGVTTAGALVVTVALFGLMDRMVARDRVRLVNAYDAQPIEFVRSALDEQTRSKDRRRQPPPKPQQVQRVSSELDTLVSRTASLPRDIAAFDVESLLGGGSSGVALGQRLVEGSAAGIETVMATDLTPLSMLPPQYPPAALMRGTEGWVELIFVVTAQGQVQDPQVVDARPRGVFDRAAVAAAERWRFRPVVRDGLAVAVRARIVVDFELPR